MLCWPEALGEEQSPNYHERRRTDNDDAKTRDRAQEIFASPSICPTDPYEDRCHHRYATSGGVYARAD